ncbi:Hypothetical predicted protein [Cloeon dipterum]|uniref:Anaphase-promoting complex subunit 4 WD40 domain-containing protein n=1 Tax=Cloeon dipterum TaxID=197152 RepID=A0A8S1CGR0_9INSE|nr:Hypothetical predicted protein [Cloeon dipterum]
MLVKGLKVFVISSAVSIDNLIFRNHEQTGFASCTKLEKITSVSWSNRPLNEDLPNYLLASASDDFFVAVWDTQALDLIQKHEEHGSAVTNLDWTKLGDLKLVSTDVTGQLVVWDLVRNTTRTQIMLTSTSRLQPFDLKCSPVDPDIVAVGCKDGLVCILNINGHGSIQSRLRGHDKSVVSLSWCLETSILASSGIDQKIIIWNNGISEKIFQIPSKSLSGLVKIKPGEKSQGLLKQPLLFLKPDLIVSGSMNAELLSWNPKEEMPSPTLLNSDHARGLFCMTHCGDVVWTIAQDRLLIRHDLKTKEAAFFSTLGGFVYSIAFCPFAPGRVAIGVGDETIRIWNMSASSGLTTTTIWQKIKGKPLFLAWHPEKEGELAFCTTEGRVGVCFVSNASKDPLILRHFHKTSVYRVCWGPGVYSKDKPALEDKMYLYTCDDNTSVIYEDANSQPTPLRIIIRASNPKIKEFAKHKDIAWKPDKTLLALGMDDGSIQLFTAPHLEIVHTLMSHKKMIFYMMWHPSNTAVEDKDQKKQNWLASCSMDQLIHVYDLSPLLSQGEEKVWKGASLPLQPMSELRHGGKVVCLAWSPHVGGNLASSSYDMSVKVWDAAKGEVLACYTKHVGCVLSCCWSALHPDIIISGASDFTCRTWEISSTSSDNSPQSRSKLREEKTGSSLVPVPLRVDAPVAMKVGGGKKKYAEETVRDSKGPIIASPSPKLSLFPISNASFLKNSIACVLHLLEGKGHEPPGKKALLEECGSRECSENHFGFFQTQEEAADLLKKEADALKKAGNHPSLSHLKLWQGETQEVIKNSTNAKKLDDWLVSLAPSVSHKFWMETCCAYAEQLVEGGNALKAASYYLLCHKETEAISVLCKNSLFKEAVAICHLRLPADDPLLQSTLAAWGKHSQDTGNFEIAVQCYVAVGDYEKAAVVLGKRKNPKLWQLGAYLAKLANATDLHLSMSTECFFAFLHNEQWDPATELTETLPELKAHKELLEVHKIICAKDKAGLNMEKVWSPSDSILTELEVAIGQVTNDDYQHFLETFTVGIQLPKEKKELLVSTSKLLLLAVAAKKCGSEDWEKHIIKVLHLNYRRSLTTVKERQLHLLLQWLGTMQLTRFSKSLEAYKATAYVVTANPDDPDLFSKLEQYKSVLLDPDCARFAIVDCQDTELGKMLAEARSKNEDVTKIEKDLRDCQEERERLLQARVAFPSALITVSSIRRLFNNFHSKEDKLKVDSFESEIDAFIATMR